MKISSIAFLSFFITTASTAQVYAKCEDGQMTKLIAQEKVQRTNEGKVQEFNLASGTPVHVLAVSPEQIKIYVAHANDGSYINGLGAVAPGSLECQRN